MEIDLTMSVQRVKCQKEFHCPVSNCLYAHGSERHFANKSLLNQHIAKVHAEKKFTCSKCNKGFGLDWWRKYHEESCGKDWTCPCGLKYLSRESLLTHARRNQHTLPSEIYNPPKRMNSKRKMPPVVQPVVVLIQPIIQQPITYVLPAQQQQQHCKKSNSTRLILPKNASAPLSNVATAGDAENRSSVSFNSTDTVVNSSSYKPKEIIEINTQNALDKLPGVCESELGSDVHVHLKEQQKCNKSVAETQTCDSLLETALRSTDLFKRRESRASQCSGRLSKHKIRFQSTCTQTVESAVIKMKKKTVSNKSRRKSVAVITEPEITKQTFLPVNQSFWHGLETIISADPGCDNGTWCKMPRYSSATQTSLALHSSSEKTLCDSQTLTDDLLQFNWSINEDQKLPSSDSAFDIISDLNSQQSTTNPNKSELFPRSISCIFQDSYIKTCTHEEKALTDVDVQFSEKDVTYDVNCKEHIVDTILTDCLSSTSDSTILKPDESSIYEKTDLSINYKNNDLNYKGPEPLNFSSVFDKNFSQQDTFDISKTPVLSHIQTQTNTLPTLDYSNFLSNMETQTTEDFLFSDLEFSDTETQTPWEDINMNDTFPADQLSIEIQTDFSSLMSDNEQCNFISDINIPNIFQTCSSKESSGIHTETQTYDQMQLPQLSNAEAQTLEASHFLFE